MRIALSCFLLLFLLAGCDYSGDMEHKNRRLQQGDVWVHGYNSGDYPSKAWHNDKIYCSSVEINSSLPNYFYCLDLKTGKVNWAAPVSNWATHPPLVCDSFIYYSSYVGELYKFDMNGRQLWEQRLNGSFAGHTINPLNQNLIVATVANGFSEYDRSDGHLVRQEGSGKLSVPVPVFTGNLMFIANTDDSSRQLTGSRLVCKNNRTGTIVWSRRFTGIRKLFVHNDHLFFCDSTRQLHCLEAETGHTEWTLPCGGNNFDVSLAFENGYIFWRAGGKEYCSNEQGTDAQVAYTPRKLHYMIRDSGRTVSVNITFDMRNTIWPCEMEVEAEPRH